ncbi:MAG TPA: tRNA (guanosine(46)-N7)-methyltransferase TrmB, partial [Bacteroidales bacterium]|nr:tRNA (guanosine(46)-N7)-methyltransferase TrmB [Bacteroidales bacterium]
LINIHKSMAKHKLERFAENKTFGNLFQHDDYDIRNIGFPLQGKWHEHFKNDHPIIVEVGCGKGEYTIALAKQFPQFNFIGMDRKGARLWRGCKDGVEQHIDNAAFIRGKIDDITYFFAPGEVAEIWVTFPDPQPKKERRRLVSPNFVEKYKQVWNHNGILHLKTDSRFLYQYLLETAEIQHWNVTENIEDVYANTKYPFLTEIQTFYEKKWLQEGSLISYIKIDF